nr:putative reverse transcriptase domain-containing protein [Tanacetum cinerariifolium]
MPPRMRTQSAGRPAAESLGEGTGVRVGRDGRGRRPREGNDECVDDLNSQGNDQGMEANRGIEGDLLPDMLAQVGNQGNVGNQNGNEVNEKVQENDRNVLVNGNWVGCSYKEFLACNSKEYDKEFCPSHEMQKLETELWNHAKVGAGHATYIDRFHELVRLVPHLVTPKSRKIERYVYGVAPQIHRMVAATKPKTIQKAVRIYGALTDEAVRNGSIKKVEKRGNVREPSKDKNGRDDNKRTRTGNIFDTTVSLVGRENMGTWPKSVPRNMNPVNARNPPIRACYECGSTDHGRRNQRNQARGKAFMLGAEEARQDPNIMTGIEPSDLGFRYEIEIASRQLVEIGKVIKGCKLEIEGHVFDIDLIPLGHGSFDVIIGMDWLSNHKAEIVCHEKVRSCRDNSRNSKTKKYKTFDWGEEQELAFQTLKDKLCNAPVLALPKGPEDFVVYYDLFGIGLGCVLMQRELFSDYDYEIRYHPGKENVVADALSKKERLKPKRVRAMNMILQSSIKDMILAAQKEVVDEFARLQKGLDEMIDQRSDGTLYYLDRIWVPLKGIAMDFVTKLPRTSSGHDTIWVIIDRLIMSAHFPPMREDYKMDRLARLYLNEIVARHGVSILIISDRDSRFTSSVRCAPFDALYGRKFRSPIMWTEVGEGQLLGLELVHETTEKISQIKDRLKAARDRQKSYADKRLKPLELSVGDYVLLKVSPWKGVIRFGKKGKLAPRFVGSFEIIEKVGPVTYRLDFPDELNGVLDTFHVSNLKKCLADPTLQVPLDEIRIDAKLNFVEEPVKILEREFKKLKRSRIAIVKVRWNSKRGAEFTWERKDQMKLK